MSRVNPPHHHPAEIKATRSRSKKEVLGGVRYTSKVLYMHPVRMSAAHKRKRPTEVSLTRVVNPVQLWKGERGGLYV